MDTNCEIKNCQITNYQINIDKFKQIAKVIRWDEDGLIPAVVQDSESGEVLMLAYMNEEALFKTIMEGRACYYSRSRQTLWLKGETSGHFQDVVDIRFDCDRDAVLLKVKQTGMACHENYFSCFHYKLGDKFSEDEQNVPAGEEETTPWLAIGEPSQKPSLSLGRTLELLAEIIKSRNEERPEGAYTTYLFTKGLDKILKKVGEECAEVIIAAKNNSLSEIRYEVADLLYHLLVLLEDRKVDLAEIADELNSRRK
ncbi:MAG TPA: bifunctional phosphoribosyl-AMP cyclohydrolase/phosphoribosyl-ATP diphosphatase HisIE [Peptococcaceae bacterium]|nr:bifunctional phosphoribosyl-AMP cyclohydrolase/phosphoribosyl-ATP diphosphatase HisIE [Peptococcaceae bacterium]